MVQLHSAMAGLTVTRPTVDVDIVLHLEVPATTVPYVQSVLNRLGYSLRASIDSSAPAHRFMRGTEQIDVMVADRLAPGVHQRLGGSPIFALPAGTQALQRTMYCSVADESGPTLISIPNLLGALVLKGAAYREDSRDSRRHLDDAAVLAACVLQPMAMQAAMKGSDRSRIIPLYNTLKEQSHPSWMLLDSQERERAIMNLRILAENPQKVPGFRKVGQPPLE
ncbi:hypothetical protein ACIPY2_18510 [Paenarthrobacter sp. NPDC089675]|uniref:hypothetical protein n=1 Tax=Paenarthrobacter sp. NPDC089675 TaxID=3364376 RepID=UPI00381DCF02